MLVGLDSGERDCEDDVVNQRAARQVVDGLAQALQHRADGNDVGRALHGLVGGVTGVEIREDEDIGAAGDRAVGRLRAADAFDACRIILDRAVDQEVRLALFCKFGCFAHLVDIAAGTRRAGRIGDHRHPRIDAEGFCRVGRLDGDFRQLVCRRVRVDGAIAIDQNLIGHQHEEDRRDDALARLRLDQLQGRAHRAGGGMNRTGDQTIDFTDGKHHGAENDGIFQLGHCLGRRHALRLAQLDHGVDIVGAHGGRVENFEIGGQFDVLGPGDHLDGIGAAEQDAAGNALLVADDGSLQRAGFFTLGQHDALIGLPCTFDQVVAEARRRKPCFGRGTDPVTQRCRVDMFGDEIDDLFHVLAVILADMVAQMRKARGRGIGIVGGGEDRQDV
ncbi:hypothetical protein D3C71_1272330 [compost metagenome]